MSADSSSVISPARWKKQEAKSGDAHLLTAVLALNDQRVELRFPDSIEADVKFLFPPGSETLLTPHDCISIDEDPPEINMRFFKTGHWLLGMGHDRGTSLQSAIGDAIFQITGKRFRDLPYGSHDLSWT